MLDQPILVGSETRSQTHEDIDSYRALLAFQEKKEAPRSSASCISPPYFIKVALISNIYEYLINRDARRGLP